MATISTIFRLLFLPACLFLALTDSFEAYAQSVSNLLQVEISPEAITPGSPFLIKVSSKESLKSLRGTWLEKQVLFNAAPIGQAKIWYAIAGEHINTTRKPGVQTLFLIGETRRGSHKLETAVDVKVESRQVQQHNPPINGDEGLENPVEAENELDHRSQDASCPFNASYPTKKPIFDIVSPIPLWTGRFVSPLQQIIVTSPFGSPRKNRLHEGDDYRASMETPVTAMNSGIAYIPAPGPEGNWVVIDHGQGLMTLYLHLQAIRVHPCQRVRKGQLVGLSGNTGNSTNPHLHVAVRWQGFYLNPGQMAGLELSLITGTVIAKGKNAQLRSPSTLNLLNLAASATWKTQGGKDIIWGVKRPGLYAGLSTYQTLENNSREARVMEIYPGTEGVIGIFKLPQLHQGQHLITGIGFAKDAKQSKIAIRIFIQPSLDKQKSKQRRVLPQPSFEFTKVYDRHPIEWRLDLSKYAGTTVELRLEFSQLNSPEKEAGVFLINPHIE